MNRRPALPDSALGDLLVEYGDRLNRLERGYERGGGGSFGLPFSIGAWKFEDVGGSIRITDIDTDTPVGITVIGDGRTVVGTGGGLGDPDVTPSVLPSQGTTIQIVTASTTWLGPHTLTFEPNPRCLDSTGHEFWPDDILHTPGLVTVTMLAAVAGKMILS